MPTFIDTRKAFRRLQEEGGFSEEEARAIVDLFRNAEEKVATRTDVEGADERLTKRIELSEERLSNRIDRIGRWLLGWMIAGFSAVAGLVILLNYVAS